VRRVDLDVIGKRQERAVGAVVELLGEDEADAIGGTATAWATVLAAVDDDSGARVP